MLSFYGFYFVFYYTILFLQRICSNQQPIMKKKYSVLIIFAFLIACNNAGANARPHGSQTDTPELTRNNYLMGFLNEYRSSYDITYYDINGYNWKTQKENLQLLPEIELNPSMLFFDENDQFSKINPILLRNS